jgi:phage antirepressor YoqD-like protein
LANKLNDTTAAAKILDIPVKNLKRWIRQGYIRKKGGRRTQDPKMEKDLKEWIKQFIQLNHKPPSAKIIKKMAMKFSNFPDRFKASKGWFEKFLIRFNQQSDE